MTTTEQEPPLQSPSSGAAGNGAALSGQKLALLSRLQSQKAQSGRPKKQRPAALVKRGPGQAPVLSFAQERLFTLQQLVPDLVAYNTPIALRLRGRLDLDALRRASDELVRRHEVLRTAAWLDGGQLKVELLETCEAPFSVTVLSEDATEADVRAAVEAEARRPFDLGRDVLLRVQVFRLAEGDHLLVLGTHHIVTDEVSKRVLTKELSCLYSAFVAGGASPLPEPDLQYADYAVWQRGEAEDGKLAEDLEWWLEALQGAPEAIDLPLDRPRPPRASHQGAKHRSLLDKELLASLKALARRERATLFMTALGTFAGLMERYSGQGDIVVGSPVSGRSRAELEKMVGLFLNTLPMRVDTSGDPNLAELVRRAKAAATGAFAHQEVPFERIVEAARPQRDLSRNPLFQVMFALRSFGPSLVELPGLQAESYPFESGSSKVDLSVVCWESERGLELLWQYNTELFDPASVEAMASHFEALARSGTRAPDAALSRLSLLNDTERQRLLVTWNNTASYFPDLPLHELVARQAAFTPELPAVADAATRLSYQDLDVRANQLAHRLAGLGVGKGDMVGVCLGRTVDQAVAFLGTLKAGAAYVPLDADYPTDRLQFMLEDTQVAALVSRTDALAHLPSHPSTILLDLEAAALSDEPATAPKVQVDPADLAHVIYTSGSTGRPKGAAIEHRALVNLLYNLVRKHGVRPEDRFLGVFSFSFDGAGFDVYVPLLAGASLFIADRSTILEPAALARIIEQQQITFMMATPGTWQSLVEGGWAGAPGLKAFSAGEALPPGLAKALVSRTKELWNVYGPTETTILATADHVQADAPVSIGKPLANTEVYLLDAHGQLVPPGLPGELFIGGVGLARGYHNRPELTAERFMPNPFQPGARMYRTGDKARFLPDGRIQHLGRLDHQVKLRGFRIEMGEIEAVLAEHDGVNEAVVVVREDAPGGRALVAYVTPAGAEPAALGAHLRQRLPGHMVPAFIVPLQSLPRSPNGKTDRNALPAPAAHFAPTTGQQVAPRNPVEVRLAAIWRSLLGTPSLGVTDDFFSLGGHSLLAARMLTKVAQEFGVRPPVGVLFAEPTIQRLAAEVQAELGGRPEAKVEGAELLRPGGGGPPLFLMPDLQGHLLHYRQLVQHLDIPGPVYGLLSRGMHGPVGPLLTMEQIAGDIVERIRRVQPAGPYQLAGYCFSGLLAYEAARQLESLGERVNFVALVDALPLRQRGNARWYGASLRDKWARARPLDWNGRWDLVVGYIGGRFGHPVKLKAHLFLASRGIAPPRFLVAVKAANFRARTGYKPGTISSRLTLVRPLPQDRQPEREARETHWHQLALGGVEMHWVRAEGINHQTMVQEPHVRLLARELSAAVRTSMAAPGSEALPGAGE